MTNNNYPLVSIIILHYKGLDYTVKCLRSLKELKYPNTETIILINGATDDSESVIKKNFKNVNLIISRKNLGFCKGNNEVFKNSKGKYVLFLNSDTIVVANFLDVLVKEMEEDKKVGVVQPKIRQMVEKNKLDAGCSFLTNTGFLYHFGYGQDQKLPKFNKKMEMYTAKGACFLARRSLIERIGLFDEDYFAYFEETDFCHRVWLSGFKVVYQPKSEIFHLGGISMSKRDQHLNEEAQFDSYKNRINCYIKNFEIFNLIKLIPSHLFFCIVISFAFLILGKPNVSKNIIKAIIWNISNLSGTLKKRKIIQETIRKIGDKDYLKKTKRNAKLSYYHFILFQSGIGDYDFK